MEFSRQECWSWLPFPSPRDLPNSGIEPTSPALAGGFFTTSSTFTSIILLLRTAAVTTLWGQGEDNKFNNFKIIFEYLNILLPCQIFSGENLARLDSKRHLSFKLYLMVGKHNWIFNFLKWFQIIETQRKLKYQGTKIFRIGKDL